MVIGAGRLDLEADVLDDVVGEQPAAHLGDPDAGRLLIVRLELQLDVLANPDVGDLGEPEPVQAAPDGDPLGDR